MNVLRHHHVRVDREPVLAAHGFQRGFEDVACLWFSEKGLTVVAGEGDEVVMA
jgi:hypothetical protein